ncbi:ArsR/SmtB family transcription factor [Haladaptatus pallidirubidus]|uniref:HTH iclR-type domain-containing protein n=1 Tax=Haladaptatus pallidirubidus TaxID=1008152 RepID=A0AAV3URN5_9EURY|nr:helix-turn-helix domain-containing protein [Haladaptatus pallidirubidus]
MSKEWDPENIFDVLGNAQARQILVLADLKPMSAQELAHHCETSLPTVYRRINELVNYDLLQKQTKTEDGAHYQVFKTDLKKVCFEIDEGGFTIDVQLKRQMVDKFEEFWQNFQMSDEKRSDLE